MKNKHNKKIIKIENISESINIFKNCLKFFCSKFLEKTPIVFDLIAFEDTSPKEGILDAIAYKPISSTVKKADNNTISSLVIIIVFILPEKT